MVDGGANRILLDNMSPDLVTSIVTEYAGEEVVFEASGGINLDTAAAYAATGVHFVSMGALTHSVRAVGFSLLFGLA